MTESAGERTPAQPDEWVVRSDPRLSAPNPHARKIDTAIVLSWVGLATVPCCGIGGITSLVAAILAIVQLSAVRGQDRWLAARARSAIIVGLFGVTVAAVVITCALTVIAKLDSMESSEVTCLFLPCD